MEIANYGMKEGENLRQRTPKLATVSVGAHHKSMLITTHSLTC